MSAADAPGEGGFTAEVAATEQRPTTVVVRAGKLLASALWSGDLYRTRYQSPPEVTALIDSVAITHVVVTQTPMPSMPHVQDSAAALAASSDWVPLALPQGVAADLRAYRRRDYQQRKQPPMRLDMSFMLNRTIEQSPRRENGR
jgi:hypothetical protein